MSVEITYTIDHPRTGPTQTVATLDSLAQVRRFQRRADQGRLTIDTIKVLAITPRQLRLALLQIGVTPGDVEQAINQLDEPQRTAALIEWEYALEIKRDHPLIATLAAALNQTDAEVDALFLAAGELT